MPEDLSGYKYIERGDFVINKMKAWQGSYAVSDYDGIVSPAYYTCKLRGVNKEFFSRAIRSKVYVGFFASYSKGIRVGQWDLDPIALKSIPFFLPPVEEQEKIVTFIDTKTNQINAFIAEREKQLQVLSELRQTIIAKTVTQGLDSNVQMKDSGVAWMSKIPAHWTNKRFAAICKQKTICNCEKEELLSVYLDRGVIKFSEDDSRRTNPTSKDLSNYQLVEYGDFVLNNQQAWRGSVGVSKHRGIVSPAYFIFELSSDIDTDFANYLFRSRNYVAYYHICSKGVGSIQRNLVWGQLKQKMVFLPPIDEQRAIVEYIDSKCKQINDSIAQIETEITHLKEYKQRLIADAVTGAINVQE